MGDRERPARPDGAAVSVIIVTYNGLGYLERCLSSVMEQVRPDDELIVVDNGSTDGGPEYVEGRVPDVQIIRNVENVGFAPACNQGARRARGSILVFLNQDTKIEHGWLEAWVRAVNGTRSGLFTSKVLIMGQPDRIQLAGQDVHHTGLVFGRGHMAEADDLSRRCEVGAVAGPSFAIRRDLWNELGGFDETFFMYYEETDLSWRAQLLGHTCVYVPDSRVQHDYRTLQGSSRRLFHASRNRYLMILKTWRWPTLILLGPSLVLAELIDLRLALESGWLGLRAKARAFLWLLSRPGEIVRKHRAVQRTRRVTDADVLNERTYRLTPRAMRLGPFGRLLVTVCNGLFSANHRFAQAICRALGW